MTAYKKCNFKTSLKLVCKENRIYVNWLNYM